MRDPDVELLARIARGDQRAARLLLDRRLGAVKAVAQRMLGDAAEAEDVAQDAMMRAWKAAPTWQSQGGAAFATWLHRVTLNLCYDRLRKRREVATDAPPEQRDESPTGFDAAHARDIQALMRIALDALPPRQRAALVLCHYEEMTNIAAAEVLEVSVEALESLLSRARRTLRERLKDEGAALLVREGATPH